MNKTETSMNEREAAREKAVADFRTWEGVDDVTAPAYGLGFDKGYELGYAAASSGPGDGDGYARGLEAAAKDALEYSDSLAGINREQQNALNSLAEYLTDRAKAERSKTDSPSSAPAPRQALGGDVEARFIELQCGENCCHSDAEHKAFDDGYYGRDSSYPDGHLRAIYGIGRSVGKLIR